MTDDIPTDLTPEGKIAWLKVQGRNSCLHCAYLYYQDTGYSNYTVEDTNADCALDLNPRLPAAKPYDWNQNPNDDNWPATQNAACARLLEISEQDARVWLDVDGEQTAWDFGVPPEVAEAISGPKENS
jgi:hypothetical protein